MRHSLFKLKQAAFLAASIHAMFNSPGVWANPTGPQVVSGQASVSRPNAATLNVTNSSGAIINWQGFSIGANEVTRFIQPSISSAVLNRVVGPDISSLQGQLLSNGRVFLINPAGIVIGPNAMIDTAGFVGSTLNMLDGDFLAGKLKFQGDASSGSIINQGWIKTTAGGHVILVAPQIENSGLIQAPNGQIILAAGKSLTIASPDHDGVQFEVQAPTDSVLNVGKLLADGGAIGVFAGTLKHSGEIRATSLATDATGQIVLKGSDSVELAAGSITDASGLTGGKGGAIQILGNLVGLTGNALIDASGDTGGGSILVGGDYQGKNQNIQNALRTYVGPDATIKADAISTGDGGKVIVWADDVTRYYGSISARGGNQSGNGGFVEVSGKESLLFSGVVDAGASNGSAGTLLLDPKNIVISTTGGGFTNPLLFTDSPAADVTIAPASITAMTSAGTSVVLQANNDITLAASSPITSTPTGPAGNITMQAGRSVVLNSDITTANGNLTITANDPTVTANRDAGAGGITMAPGTTLNAGSGTVTLTVGTGIVGAASGNIVVENISAANVNLQQKGASNGSSILRASSNSLITATNVLLEVDLNDSVSGGSVGTSAAPMRIQAAVLESHTHEASPGIFIDSPNPGNLQVGDVPFFTGSVKGVQNVTSGDISLTVNGALSTQAGTAGCGATGGTGGPICGGNITLTASNGDLNLGSVLTHIGAGAGTLNARASNSILVGNGANITSSGGAFSIVLNSDSDGNGAGAISFGTGGAISVNSNGGNILFAGDAGAAGFAFGTASDDDGIALNNTTVDSGAGTITMRGTGRAAVSSEQGINLFGGSIVSSSSGAINLTGTGGAGSGSDNVGIRIADAGTTVQTTGSGNITLTGQGGGGSDNNNGVRVENSALVFSGGALTVDGRGFGVGGSNSGIKISGATLQSVGLLMLIGQGGSGTGGNNDGIRLEGTSSLVKSAGAVSITGTGGTGDFDTVGIKLSGSNAKIESSGGGTIALVGTAGPGTNDNNNGVRLESSAIITTAGAISVTGTGAGSGSENSGIKIGGATIESTGTGSVTLVGIGGGGAGSGNNNDGVRIESGGTLRSVNGTLSVDGSGGTGGDDAVGIKVSGGTVEATGSGSVALIGQGGSGTNNNHGVRLESNALVQTGSGNLTLDGQGGTGTNNFGVFITGGTSALSASGAIILDGSGTQIGSGPTVSAGGSVINLGLLTLTGGAITGDVTNQGTLELSGGTVTGTLLNQGSLNLPTGSGSISGGMAQEAGSVTVAAGRTLTVGGTGLDWQGGALAGLGSYSLASLTISGTGARVLNGPTLSLASLTIPGGSLEVRNGTLAVAGTTTVDPGTTLQLTGGTFAPAGAFNNNGTFDVDTGTLNLAGGGTSAGTFDLAASTALNLTGGTHTFNTGAAVIGAGTLNVSGATLAVGAPVTATNLALSSGAISGAGTLTASNAFNWTGGNFSGTGKLVVASGATLTVSGASSRTIFNGYDLDNLGTVNLTQTGTVSVSGTPTSFVRNFGTWNANHVSAGILSGFGEETGGGSFLFTNEPGATLNRTVAGEGIMLNLSNNGALNVHAGTLTLDNRSGIASAGTFLIDSGTTLKFVHAAHTVNGSFLAGTGSGTIAISPGVAPPTTLNIATSVVSDDVVQVPAGAILNVTGTANASFAGVTLSGGTVGGSGNLTVTSSFNQTSGTHTGTGTTILGPSATSTLGAVTVARMLSVQGTLGLNGTTLNGLLTNTGTLNVTGSSTANAGVVQQSGAISVASGQTLTVGAPGLDWQGGALQGTNAASYSLSSMTISGSGARVLNGPSFTITNLNLPGGSLEVQSGALNLAGTTTIASGATFAYSGGTVSPGGPIINNGVLNLSGSSLLGFGSTGGLSNNGTVSLAGASSIRLQDTGSGYPAFTNAAGSTLTIDSTAGWSFFSDAGLQGGILNNAGTINVNNSTSWEAAFSNTASGTLNIAAGKYVSMQNGQTIAGAVNLGAGSTLWVSERHGVNASFNATTIGGTGTVQVIAGNGPVADFTNVSAPTATLLIGNGGQANILAGSTTFGTLNMTGGLLSGAGTLNVAGAMNLSGGSLDGSGSTILAGVAAVGALSVNRALTNQGTLNLNGSSLFGLLSNSGTLTVSGSVSAGAGIQQTAGLLNLPAGQTLGVGGSGLVLAGGTLAGRGTIVGNVNNVAATVAPGASPGTLTITGNYTQGPSGTLLAEIGGTVPGTQYDQLIVSGNASLDGTFNATLFGGYVPAGGEIFNVIQAGTVSGTFATTSGPAGITGTYLPGGFDLTVSGVVPPPPVLPPASLPVLPLTLLLEEPSGPISQLVVAENDWQALVLSSVGLDAPAERTPSWKARICQ